MFDVWSRRSDIVLGDEEPNGVDSIVDAIEQADRNDEFGDLIDFLTQTAPRRQGPMSDMIKWLEHTDLSKELSEDRSFGTGSTLETPPAQDRRRWLGEDDAPLAPPTTYTQQLGLLRGADADERRQMSPACCGGVSPAELAVCCQTFREGHHEQCALRTIPEDAWHERLKTTGVSGRLVMYKKGEMPREDITLDSRNGRLTVATVVMGGKACRAGVRPGDVLVSIDGRKDFVKNGDEVHAGLDAPVLLVFIGFVGKLEAEVQLNHPKAACGLSLGHEFVVGRSEEPAQVIDEVVFEPISPLCVDDDECIVEEAWSSYDRSAAEKFRTPRI
eukprot:CAMPEP_0194485896 /NCGR_PEP_ID=MMETSP0253-20130528/6743_1 /TAXON_ID=2966 /ORGANISM="Noctiluca scintillans" /LENGTH=329 /DNA_ID=CAMNT_0039325921 /DNA_START=33 /DNA_END=1022 /DNA_ORIENTATION=-